MGDNKILMKGNEAIGEAAVKAGCKHYFAYPITPQSEIPQYLAKRLPETGGVYLQAESEVAAINMVYGAAGSGVRVMTSSSSPGISLKQEGISYIAGAELPCVLVNIVRGGPGLGSISPAQSDYFQATKGGGHGDYRLLVLAPYSVQEMIDLTMLAFDLADVYRNPVMILGDGVLGQMMEPVEFKPYKPVIVDKNWAATGRNGRDKNIISSIHLLPEALEKHNQHLQEKYEQIKEKEIRWQEYKTDNADIIVVAYGITARIVKNAVDMAREAGIPVGLFRPITLFPFPYKEILNKDTKILLTVEMSAGQMVEDVRLAAAGTNIPVYFHGRMGGVVPTPEEIFEKIKNIYNETSM